MNKQIKFTLLALVAVASLALADSDSDVSAKDTKKIVQNNFLETEQKGIKLSGYVDAGYSYNFNSANGSRVVGREGVDSSSRGDFNLYAFKMALEKSLSSENRAQAGFRVDVMIGEDANYLANRNTIESNGYAFQNGFNTDQDSNALFLEQAYVSLRAPVGNGWDFKVGKFVSILGYEVIERPANMNVTYGLLWNQFPLYYTGVLSSYKFDDYLDGKLGVVNGSNTDNNTTTSGEGDGCAVLAALNVTAPGSNANWSNNFQYSSNSENNTSAPRQSDNTTPVGLAWGPSSATGYTFIYNSWGNWAPKFSDDKLLFAFNTVLGTFNSNDANSHGYGSRNLGGTTWYGAGLYTKYQFSDFFALGSRAEYLGGNNEGKLSYNDDDGYSYVNGGSASSGLSLWEYTLTSSFNVIDNLLLRAEYRMDWGNASNVYNNNGSQKSSGSGPSYYGGAEIVYSF